MKTKQLVSGFLHDACEENQAFYKQLIEHESLDAVKDEQWRKVIVLARSLSKEDQKIMLAFARQAAIDSISTICGGIDGNTQIGNEFLEMSLTDSDGQQHAGSLQDEFLSIAYRPLV